MDAPPPGPPPPDTSPHAGRLAWGLLAVLFGATVAAAWAGMQPPRPQPAGIDPTRFSEARARVVLQALTGIGLRPNATPGHARAVGILTAQLARIPGLEVEVQQARGARVYEGTPYPYPALAYRVANVVARLPGRSREAVLLDAHFDTLGDGPGAGDDAVGVAVMVEVLRALAAGGTPARSVVALLNGGEEGGLFGADGFARGHRWARDVRGYVYIDGTAGGRGSLIVTTHGHGGLVDAYAAVAPRPLSTVLFQDLVDSNQLSQDGDMRPLDAAGHAGLSLAAVGDMWSTHTARDVAGRVEPGTLQHLGDTALALARRLASDPQAARPDAARRVYFDIFGRGLVKYTMTTARGLGVLALGLAAAALALLLRRRRVSPRQLAAGVGWSALALGCGLLASLAAGVLLAFVLRRPHGWYATPWLVAPAFAAPALAALLAVHAAWRRRWSRREGGGEAVVWAAWGAALAGWSGWLLLATLAGAGAGYLALAFVAPSAVALLAALRWPRWRVALGLAALVPGVVVVASLALPLLRVMVPQTGFLPLPVPADPLIALCTGLLTLMVAGAAVSIGHDAGRPGRAAWVLAVVAAAGMAGCALRFPWTAARPRRVLVTHVEQAGRSALLLRPFDALPAGAMLAAVPGARPTRPGWAHDVFMPYPTHEVPAPPPAFAPPSAEVAEATRDPATGTRTVTLRLHSGTQQLRLLIPRARLAGWSLTDRLPTQPADAGDSAGPGDDRHVVHFEGFPPEGDTVQLRLRGDGPVPIELRATTPVPSPEMEALVRRMPAWTVPWPTVMRVVRMEI